MIIQNLTNFGIRVSTTFKSGVPALADDTNTVDGLTAGLIAGGVSKEQLDLSAIQNYTLKGSWSAGDPVSEFIYASPATSAGLFNDLYSGLFVATPAGNAVFANPTAELKAVVEPAIPEHLGPVSGPIELADSKALGLQQYLYDTVAQVLYQKNGSEYITIALSELPNLVKPGRFYLNKATKYLFYAETSASLIKF